MNPDATVGIVLVSHSAALADGAAELASQVAGGAVAVIPAGGTDDGGLGTSAAKVEEGGQAGRSRRGRPDHPRSGQRRPDRPGAAGRPR